jgi:hypothetical protein
MTATASTPNPITGFNIATATAKEFKQLVADFTAWSNEQPPPESIALGDGWHDWTPEHSLAFLRRTVMHKANRTPSFNAVSYYAQMMKDGDWQPTGQTIILPDKDGQHRAWAGLLSGISFRTYVVATAPDIENAFAYIDNSKIRSAADALETAGHNGLAREITAVIRLARHYDAGVMTPASKGHMPKASPIEVLRYLVAHDGLQEAVGLMASEYPGAVEIMLREHVAGFVAFKILTLFGEDTLDEFMRGLIVAETDGPNTAGNPLVALRKKLKTYQDSDNGAIPAGGKRKLTSVSMILAHIIKAFGAWHIHQAMKAVQVRVDETFPRFEDAAAAEEAAQ